jgi:hypothetical protein
MDGCIHVPKRDNSICYEMIDPFCVRSGFRSVQTSEDCLIYREGLVFAQVIGMPPF